MKAVVIIFAVFLTGTNGQLGSSAVRRIISQVSENITALGLDPLLIPKNYFNFNISETDLLLLEGGTGGGEMTGLANMELERFRLTVSLQRVTLTLTFPNITFNFINETFVRFKFFDLDFSMRLSGSVSILDTSLSSTIRVRVGVIRDLELRSAEFDFTIGKIVSNLKVELMNRDVSDRVNNFMNTTIPNTISDNRSNINELLQAIVLQAAGSA